MKYSEHQVLDIIKSATDLDPVKILNDWNTNQANTPLDLSGYAYPLFLYSFPVIFEGEEVATITLADLYNCQCNKEFMIKKYLGHQKHEESYSAFSHDTYLSCFLTINEEIVFPEIVKGFRAYESEFTDAGGEKVKYRISYGYPENEDEHYLWEEYADNNRLYNVYRFDDINVQIEKKDVSGHELGAKINEAIELRKSLQ